MIEVFGNLWTYPTEWRVITTNGFVKKDGNCVMGRGCAKEASDKYPELSYELGRQIKAFGNRVFGFPRYNIITMPVKRAWWEPASLDLILQSTQDLVLTVDKLKLDKIVMPRPGCGNGKLHWKDVRPILQEHLDDRFHVITFGIHDSNSPTTPAQRP